MQIRQFYCYILTNPTKTVLYVGITNNLPQRITEHYLKKGLNKTFTGRYNCFNLLYYEVYRSPIDAISREKQIKGWTRKKKEALIESQNPEWRFLNEDIMDWPPPAGARSRGQSND